MKWVDVRRLFDKAPDASIYMIIGARSNGKTYSALDWCMEDYVKHERRFVYARRLAEMVRMIYMRNLFTGNKRTGNVQHWMKQLGYEDIQYFSSAFWPAVRDEKGKMIRIENPCGYTVSLSTWETSKGGYFPNVGTIIFDEFLTRQSYLPEEPTMFENVLSSLIRDRGDVKVLMLANTVSWTAPYFREWGLNHVEKMKMGTMQEYVSGDNKRKIVLWYTEPAGVLESQKYLNFDNAGGRMIAKGYWQTAEYPRIPPDLTNWTMGEPCYVQSIDDWTIKLQPAVTPDGMEVVLVFPNGKKVIDDDGMDVRYRDRIVYTDYFYPYINCKFCITKHADPYSKFILNALKQGRVFYQNNTVGEYLRAYLIFSTKYTPIPS